MNAWTQAACRDSSKTLQKVWQCAKEILSNEELNKLILSTDAHGMTAWHFAANSDNSETLQNVWECAEEILTIDEFYKLV